MSRRNRDRGFTLIELLIVVTIILIIAAFTIPKITKSQIPAHEASAIASIKAINAGEMIYSSSHPDLGFTADLLMLGGTAQSGGTVERTRKVCLEIQTKGPAPADAQLDPLYVWAVQTLLADSTLPTLLRWRSLHDARIQWDTQAGASDLAVALVVFTFDYYTTRLDPTLLIPG